MNTQAWKVVAAASVVSIAGAAGALAQSEGPMESPGTKADTRADTKSSGAPAGKQQRRAPAILRRPVIDLEEQAKARRPGQIMPGDPAPGSGQSGAVIELPQVDRVEPAPTPVPIKREPAPREPTKREAPKAVPAEPMVKPEIEAPPAPTPVPVPARVEQAREVVPAVVEPAQAEPLPELPPVSPEVSPEVRVETPEAPARAVATDIQPRRDELRPVERAPREVPSASVAVAAPAAAVAPIAPAETDRAETTAAVAQVAQANSSGAIATSPSAELPPVTVLGPARVQVLRAPGDDSVEWRSADAAWSPASTAASANGRVEVRAGLDGESVLVVEDRVEVRIGRLARVAIETAAEVDGTKTVHLTLGRGMIEVRPIEPGAGGGGSGWSQWVARVRTPDRAVALVGASSIEYDAFAGAKVKMLGNDGGPR